MSESSVRKGLSLFLITLLPFLSHSQIIRSIAGGSWMSPNCWEGGVVPSITNHSRIEVNHPIAIPATSHVAVNGLSITGSLDVDNGAELTLNNGPGAVDLQVTGTWSVKGQFIHQDLAVVEGTSVANTHFDSMSVYRYRWTTASSLPVIKWHEASTLVVEGFNTNVSILSPSWNQSFGNFIYDCPGQGSFMDFNGRLTSVQGDLIIRNTNNRILRLARGHTLSLVVGGDFVIEGPTEIWCGESGEFVSISVGRNFEFRAQSTASSYLTLSGRTQLSVAGDFILDSSYKLKFASASGGTGELRASGNISLIKGTIDALGTGRGRLVFDGTAQLYLRRESAMIEGNFDVMVQSSCSLDVGTSLLNNTLSGSIEIFGELIAGSVNPGGIIQAGAGGNIVAVDTVIFHPGSVLTCSALQPQYLGSYHGLDKADVMIRNRSGVFLTDNLSITNLTIFEGDVYAGQHELTIHGSVDMNDSVQLHSNGTIIFDSDANQIMHLNGSVIRNLDVRGTTRTISLTSELLVAGLLSFSGSGIQVESNGFLQLISTTVNDANGGRIGTLSNGNKVNGSVYISRVMPGASRAYRYISSPVSMATVASWMDDFPITGSFIDPSKSSAIISSNPSLFEYDASMQSWRAFPTGDSAKNNVLYPGRGYAAYMWTTTALWDVTGPIHQGPIELPVAHPLNDRPGWNLVGNPYPCPIDWNSNGWVKEHIANGIAVKDNLAGRFRIWDGSLGDLPNGTIAIGQAFWVRTTAPMPRLATSEPVKNAYDAVFYRTPLELDYAHVSASQSTHSDNAYLRIRPGAKSEIDEYDIPKLKNDFLSLSLITEGGKELALWADQILPCDVNLMIKLSNYNTHDTIYLDVVSYGKLAHAMLTFRDRRTGNKIKPNKEGKFPVAPADASHLALYMQSKKALASKIELPAVRCTSQSLEIKIKNWQPGFEYVLVNDSVPIIATTQDSQLRLVAPWYEGNHHLIKIGICDADTQAVNISSLEPVSPSVESMPRCGPGPMRLKISNTKDDQTYDWMSNDSIAHTGPIFDIPFLQKTRTYGVKAKDLQSGCVSEMIAVEAIVLPVDSIPILYDGHKLSARAEAPLDWFFSGQKLEYHGATLIPEETGSYIVKKPSSGGKCPSVGVFTLTALKSWKTLVYPNPTDSEVRFPIPTAIGILKDIIDVNGASVFYLCDLDCFEQECRLEIRSLSPGVYFLTFDDKGHLFYIRFFVY